jgi:cell division protein FtsI (penicillin-binding protein 3)
MRLIERRVGLLFASFVFLLAIVLVRAVWLQGVRGGELSASATAQQTESVVVPGHRGAVLDRREQELAVSEDAATVFATPYQVKDPAKTAERLSPVLHVPASTLLRSLSARESGFAYLRRKLDLGSAQQVQKMDIAGIGVIPDSRRVYPQGDLAAQVIGAVGVDNQGLSGLEAQHEELLHGTDGERRVTRDALGQPIERETVSGESTGQDLELSIDSEIQSRTEQALAGIGTTYQPKGATAIVMDPRSSEVLAMANWPTVDPQNLSDASQQDLENRATGFTYEPGSTFKAFTVAAALEDHKVTPQTMFNLPPMIRVADRKIEEAHGRPTVDLSVADILAQSSNVGAVKIGLEVGASSFDHWIRQFGFGETTGIDYPGEEQGIVPALADYSGSTMGNLPLGQGLSVTPMQMAAAYSAIANGGVLRTPRLVLKEAGQPVDAEPGTSVISSATAAKIRRMLEGVLAPGGTASEVSVPGYKLAGKTGTSEKAVDGGYSTSRYVASFVGFAPAADPRLLVAIVVDEPHGDIYGGSVAAPAFGQIAKFALPYLGIPPS